MKNLFIILIIAITITSCSEYQKALQSEDVSVKYKMGEKMFNEGKFAKANKIFEQIIPAYRGKPQAEKLMFLNAESLYKQNDYYYSSYHFERFVSAYPKSDKLSEASFKSAASYYQLSPVYSKDQAETITALEKLQEFINQFPNSENVTQANKYVKELDSKLEIKAFEIAKQYNRISDFKASIAALDNFISDFPGTKLREEALYIRFDSAYQLAVKSVEYKKKERLEIAKKYYYQFVKRYTSSAFAENMKLKSEEIDKQFKQYSIKS